MSVAHRVARLEGPLPGGRLPAWMRALAAELATDAGLDPTEVVREAKAVLIEAEVAGVLGSVNDLAAFISGASGRSPEAILAEAQQMLASR